ncbi:ImmA/IrrE family metallo-endopeptidase [Geobacter sp. SVR]|uniref:ImmA/IrrE family metallo-endopeptidase n=1 Tax=Geobacter sp. SVR TaxID=2495594 RepID=UPI0015666990|nr:ImmA/IrrE family metallo-endopeptidase [Geobacter sp. SVR]
MSNSHFSFSPMSGRQIDQLANSYLSYYQPEALRNPAPFDVHRFVDTKLEDLTGVVPVYSRDLPPEIYGLTDSSENRLEIQETLAEDPFQEKFFRSTLAHEAGHCIIHVPQLRKINRGHVFRQAKEDGAEGGVKLYRKDDIPLYCNPEWQAFRFAGALLIPEGPLRMMLASNASTSEIADTFNIHPAFLRSRMKALKLT